MIKIDFFDKINDC